MPGAAWRRAAKRNKPVQTVALRQVPATEEVAQVKEEDAAAILHEPFASRSKLVETKRTFDAYIPATPRGDHDLFGPPSDDDYFKDKDLVELHQNGAESIGLTCRDVGKIADSDCFGKEAMDLLEVDLDEGKEALDMLEVDLDEVEDGQRWTAADVRETLTSRAREQADILAQKAVSHMREGTVYSDLLAEEPSIEIPHARSRFRGLGVRALEPTSPAENPPSPVKVSAPIPVRHRYADPAEHEILSACGCFGGSVPPMSPTVDRLDSQDDEILQLLPSIRYLPMEGCREPTFRSYANCDGA